MQYATWKRAVFGGALLLVGCPAEDGGPPSLGAEGSSGGGPMTTDAAESSDASGDSFGTTTGATETTMPGSESSDTLTGGNFIVDPDGASISVQCSIWDQDCPPGEKCMPWANDGGNSWNATRCTPVANNPGQPGDPCTVEGSGVSGVDDCAVGAMCWNVDGETNTGTCLAFCMGSENNPLCDDPQTACSITNEGVLALCLETCDPLQQNCPTGEGCWQVDESFVCAPDASAELGGYGDPCEAINVCDPFLACLDAVAVPGCEGSSGCCTEFCDLDEPDASQMCAGFADGQQCIPAFEEGQAPPDYGHVGYCILPS